MSLQGMNALAEIGRPLNRVRPLTIVRAPLWACRFSAGQPLDTAPEKMGPTRDERGKGRQIKITTVRPE